MTSPTYHGPVVCIGASWGGANALRIVLGGLPDEFEVPVCIVQHRGEDHGHVELVGSLARVTGLRVCEPEDKQPLRPRTVFIAPAGYHMLLEDGHLALSLEDRVRWARPSIDVLFETAAITHGAGTTAVVLTGANDDGARGARAIHDAGGIVIAQDPDEAERHEMPRAAIDTGAVDEVLPLGDIADAVLRRVGENAPT